MAENIDPKGNPTLVASMEHPEHIHASVKDLQDMEKRMNKRFDKVDQRLDKLDRKLDRKTDTIDSRLLLIESHLGVIITALGIEEDIKKSTLETVQDIKSMRDRRIENEREKTD